MRRPSRRSRGEAATTSSSGALRQTELPTTNFSSTFIGSYAGTVLFDEDEGEHSVAFKIDASGFSWKVTIKPINSARTWNGTSKLSGRGDDVVQLDPISSGLTALNITHSGQDNFIVKGYSDSGTDLMVNEIGKYKGQVPLADGSFLVTVQADGSWTMIAAQ